MTTAFEEVRDALRTHGAGSGVVSEPPKEYQAALHKRAQELRTLGVQYPEATARVQLQRESQARSEEAERRAAYEHMNATANAHAEAERQEWEKRAAKPLTSRTPQAGDPYVIPGDHSAGNRDRVAEKLMAQYHSRTA